MLTWMKRKAKKNMGEQREKRKGEAGEKERKKKRERERERERESQLTLGQCVGPTNSVKNIE